MAADSAAGIITKSLAASWCDVQLGGVLHVTDFDQPEFVMRSIRFAALLAAFAVFAGTTAAQIPKSVLVAVVQSHKASVLRYIDAAPDSMMGFRPTKGVRSFAEQIEHAAGSDAAIAHMAITGSMNTPSFGDTAVIHRNKAALRAYAVAAMDHSIQMLQGVTDAQLMEQVTMMNMKMPRYRFLFEMLDHFPWTLGQTVPYLRLNGVTPPEYSPF